MSVDLLENCQDCYAAQLNEFPATLTIKGHLTATTNYILKVTDKFGNAYSAPATATDGAGVLTMNTPVGFPLQWFNRNNGKFKFEVSLVAQPWHAEILTFNSEPYTCIWVEFVKDVSLTVIQ